MLCKAFADLGADYQPPTGFIRIPGHVNGQYPEKPLVECIFESDSIFTLSEIHEILKENGIAKKSQAKPMDRIQQGINELLKGGVLYRKRDRAAFTISNYFNRHLGLSQEEAIERLLEWNTRLIEPLPQRTILKCIRSSYKKDYDVSIKWLDYLTENEPSEIQQSYKAIKESKRGPKRISISTHAEKIRVHILSNGGALEISQRKLAKGLEIPWRSYIEALKLIPNLHISTVGKGRNAKSILRFKQDKRLKLVQ